MTIAWAGIGLSAILGASVIVFASTMPIRSQTLRQRIIETLSERLDSDVALEELSLRLLPRLHAEGRHLVIRQRNHPDQPPLIELTSFNVDAGLVDVWRKHVARVEVTGLVISIPPKRDGETSQDARPHPLHAGAAPPAPASRPYQAKDGVVIDVLDANGTRLVIIPREVSKAPKLWSIHTLRMRAVGTVTSSTYDATLTNAVPPGEIDVSGHFGPWNRDDPGGTPLDGTFTFDHADLSVFRGIGGMLSSRGSFAGSLGWIEVNGETNTPNFVIDVGGHPFSLHATYRTIVDGTNGDTRLDRIDADFLKSSLVARGAVLDALPGKGRTVSLDIEMNRARVEDLMVTAVKNSTPPMVGEMRLRAAFLLPPGETDVVDRLKLDGRFTIAAAQFTSDEVQRKIVELSWRGRGMPGDVATGRVASDFRGRFTLRDGRLSLRDLAFAVPGAQVRLAGSYGLRNETIDFKGNLLLDAKLSQTVTGFKSLLLKIIDPLFSKPGGGSSIPIKIEGTRSEPRFGLDRERVFNRGHGVSETRGAPDKQGRPWPRASRTPANGPGAAGASVRE
jgi:hypothetical protein